MNELQKMIALEKDACAFGFEWPNQDMIIAQLIDECREIKEDIETKQSTEKIQEEIGDLLLASVSLCAFLNIDFEETLKKANIKFQKRMSALKSLTEEFGLKTLQGQSIDTCMQLWKKAKTVTEKHSIKDQ